MDELYCELNTGKQAYALTPTDLAFLRALKISTDDLRPDAQFNNGRVHWLSPPATELYCELHTGERAYALDDQDVAFLRALKISTDTLLPITPLTLTNHKFDWLTQSSLPMQMHLLYSWAKEGDAQQRRFPTVDYYMILQLMHEQHAATLHDDKRMALEEHIAWLEHDDDTSLFVPLHDIEALYQELAPKNYSRCVGVTR